jgi:uncharacterized RDD family membrane protein YckC
MACPHGGDDGSCASAGAPIGPEERAAAIPAMAEPLPRPARRARARYAPTPVSVWREEVVNRVENYRHRRSRKHLAGQYSMRFNFGEPPATPEETGNPGAAAMKNQEAGTPGRRKTERVVDPQTTGLEDFETRRTGNSGAAELEQRESEPPSPQVQISLDPPLSPAPDPQIHKSASFQVYKSPSPQSLLPVPVFPEFEEADLYELAEPMFDQPRILEASEVMAVAPPPLSDIAFDTKEEERETPPPPPEPELPLRVAGLPRRGACAAIDAILAGLGAETFALVVLRYVPGLAHAKPALPLAFFALLLFWWLYHYLFLVHRGATLGMLLARIRLAALNGKPVRAGRRRWRSILMVLSGAPLGLGFLWAIIDERHLGWHDHLTGTYLTSQ